MDGYRIALFLHLCALMAGVGASGLVLLVMLRVRSAATGREALPWLALGKSAARTFPVALVVLVATGAYMVQHSWTLGTGWVDVGLAGAVLLGVVGDRLEGRTARRVAASLAADPDAPAAAVVRSRIWWTATLVNPAIVVGIVFLMATKPSLAGSIGALVVAILVGGAVGWRLGG